MIRIVNTTGKARDTRVLDGETGEDLTARLRITKIELVLDAGAGNVVQAILHCFAPAIDFADVAVEVVQAE